MRQVVQNMGSGKLSVEDVPRPTVQPGGLLVATRASLISVGTERATVGVAKKSLVGKAMERPDLVRKVIQKAQKDGLADTMRMVSARLDVPSALGYSCAGVVLQVGEGVAGFAAGDRVACAGQNHASHAEVVFVPQNLCVKLPDAVSFDDAAYVTVGAIALQGVRQADPKLGDAVAVIGLGLVGQLTVQLLRANGCRVLAADPDAEKQALARELGAEQAVAPEALVAAARTATEGHGVDAVLIAASTKESGPVELAGEIARKKGRIVVVGAVGMTLPREPYYLKELELRLSTSYGPGRYDPEYEEKGRDYPYGYVRWTERRNMAAFIQLLAEQRMNVGALTRFRVPIARAEEAYSRIMDATESPLGVLLTYEEADGRAARSSVTLRGGAAAVLGVRLGLIGAGSHVKDMLVPALKGIADTAIVSVCTQRGINAKALAARVGAATCTTDYRDVLADDTVNAVIVGTRHNLHAEIVLAALRAGKHVFVEKPLCLTTAELDEIASVYAEKAGIGLRLAVGFNRRFSPHFVKAKEFLGDRRNPLVMTYRVNAGALPADHWTQDPAVGGGRIIGEGCHFVDYLQALSGGSITSVHASAIGEHGSGIVGDQAILSLRFSDGSVGTVIYAAGGDTALAKERCEVFGDGKSIVMDDFARSEFYGGGRRTVFKTSGRDKGFGTQMKAFCASLTNPEAEGMAFDDILSVTRTCLAAVESMADGAVKPL
jgi:predicted dehydrogenase